MTPLPKQVGIVIKWSDKWVVCFDRHNPKFDGIDINDILDLHFHRPEYKTKVEGERALIKLYSTVMNLPKRD